MYCCPERGWPGPQRTSWRINDGDVDERDSGKRQEELEEPGRDCEGEDETHTAFLPHSLKCAAVLFKALENSDNHLGAVFLGTWGGAGSLRHKGIRILNGSFTSQPAFASKRSSKC